MMDLSLTQRLRRLRKSPGIRDLVRETNLTRSSLVYPLFVCTGSEIRKEVPSMPGVCQLSVDQAILEAKGAEQDGLRAVLLFGLPDSKDDNGSAAWDPDAPVQSAVRAIKSHTENLLVITDVCLIEKYGGRSGHYRREESS